MRPRRYPPHVWTTGGSVAVLPLPRPRAPVVVAVRGAQHGVDVERLRGVVVEEDPAVVIQLRDHHGRLHPVVEDVAGLVAADPAEPRLVPVRPYFAQPGGAWPLGEQSDETLDDAQHELLRLFGHVGDADALERNHPVVLEGT